MNNLLDKNFPLHEKLEIGLLLAVVGGFLDAYSYICYGGVFANAQTGNMVLLGIAVINGDYIHFVYYLIPIMAFAIGIVITEYLLRHLSDSFFIWILVIEIIILFIMAFLPADMPALVVTAAISFMCSIQIGSFRKICGAPYSSTMCTGNLRSAMESLFVAMSTKNSGAFIKSMRYLSVIFFFCVGAAVGAVLIDLWGIKSILFCCLLFAIILLMLLRELRKLKQQNKFTN